MSEKKVVVLPCPHCNGDTLKLRAYGDAQIAGPGWTVMCENCLHMARLKQWNSRASFWRRVFPSWYAKEFNLSE